MVKVAKLRVAAGKPVAKAGKAGAAVKPGPAAEAALSVQKSAEAKKTAVAKKAAVVKKAPSKATTVPDGKAARKPHAKGGEEGTVRRRPREDTVAKDKSEIEKNGETNARKSGGEGEQTLREIVKDLKSYGETEASKSEDLLSTSKSIFLQLTLSRSVAQADRRPILLDLPHPLYMPDTHKVCLITKRPQRFWKDKLEAEIAAGTAGTAASAAVVKKVIDFDHLRKKFPTGRDKRLLATDFDLFLADEKMIHLLPGQLGSHFVKAKKCPLACSLRTTKSIGETVAPLLRKTQLLLRPGHSVSLRVAHTDNSVEEITQNLVAALKGAKKHFGARPVEEGEAAAPGGDQPWKILAANLHLQGSISLPIFSSFD